MNDKPRFDVIYLEEAIDFIKSQNEKVRGRLMSNYSRNSMTTYGSSELNIMEWHIVFLHFGIMIGKQWLSPRMDW